MAKIKACLTGKVHKNCIITVVLCFQFLPSNANECTEDKIYRMFIELFIIVQSKKHKISLSASCQHAVKHSIISQLKRVSCSLIC